MLKLEKKRQQSHYIEILEDKVGKLKKTNIDMKRKIGTLQHQQDDQTNLMTQHIEVQRKMQSEIQQLFHRYEGKKAGGQMVVIITLVKKQNRLKIFLAAGLNCFILSVQ